MKFLEHIKLAAFTGIVVGTVHGTIDIIIRIAVLSFEWFEFYQSLLIPVVAYTLGFVALSLFLELIRRIIKLKITNKSLTTFYFTSSIFLLIFFYVSVILNRFLIREIAFWSPLGLSLNFAVLFVIGTFWILLITKLKGTVYSTINLLKKRMIKKLVNTCIFAVIIFIIISFFMDVYLLNYIPSSAPNTELNEYPNILLIEIDTLRADHLSLYGYPFNTSPNIDELAKDAIVFDTAIGPASGSLPVISSIFTGKYLSNHGTSVINQELSIKETTLAETLKAKGYNTAGFVAAIFYKAKYGIGQGFNTYKDRMDFFEFQHTFEWFGLRQTLFTFTPIYKSLMKQDGYVTSSEVNKDALKWLKNNKYQPFFLYVHYADPHYTNNLDNKFIQEFRNNTGPLIGLEDHSKDAIDSFFRLYDAAIKYSDSNVGELLNKLDELNLKDNTIIIIIADHGIEYYDHGILTGESMYQSMIHVPLIIYYPKELKPQRIRTPVSTIDILPTVFDMLNIEVPDDIDGTSLLPLMTGEGTYSREFVASETYGREGIEDALQQIAIIKGDWKLIEIRQSEILSSGLYNLRTDPKEQRNLYDVYIEKRKELQKHIPEITSTMNISTTS